MGLKNLVFLLLLPGATLWSSSLRAAATLADSIAEWSATGAQGQNGWYYGYFNLTKDANKTYETGDFIQFQPAQWTGTQYDLLVAAAGPWTELGQESTHPNGTNSAPNEEHWTIRRWTSDYSGTAVLTWHMRKTNAVCGNGIGGKLFVNGVEVDSATIGGTDATGVTRFAVRALTAGVKVDLAITPNGEDGCDGSAFWLKVSDDLSSLPDFDKDGVYDAADNCPTIANANQANSDGDALGDACDNCPSVSNQDQMDRNQNGIGDACEDSDGDGAPDATDNCLSLPNASQADTDGDGHGNACDNCPTVDNHYQADSDQDGIGDACDPETPDSLPGPFPVTINELHYHPLEGEQYEFLELHNASSAAVDVGLWSFREGLSFKIQPGVEIPARGYLVLCSHPESLAVKYGVPADQLIWWGSSNLDNGGEKVVLADALGQEVDQVDYDDDPPWDIAADGTGPSLQRRCTAFEGSLPANWAAAPPTPQAANAILQCPPPLPAAPAVAISEIYYHPPDDLEAAHEFVELVNTTAQTIDLAGYKFSQGIDFTFAASTPLGPGQYLVVCRDEAAVRSAFGIANTAGNFIGQLSNEGERLTLLDAQGQVADSVRYEDSGRWPVGADGLGFSLEKIVPSALSGDPASWMDSGAADAGAPSEWQTISVMGRATSNRLYFFIEDVGEFLIDNASLVDVSNPGVNLLPNYGFPAGLGSWTPVGNHSGSRWSQAAGGTFYDEPALHLIAADVGTGSANSVRVDATQSLDLTGATTYRLTFSYLYLSGSSSLVARLSQASPGNGIYWRRQGGTSGSVTPGKENVVNRSAVPPFVSGLRRWPLEPSSTDTVWISALVSGSPSQVILTANLTSGARTFTMLDDGNSFDGEAGDGVFGVELPAQPHHTAVTFSIEARSAQGNRSTPLRSDPMKLHGYYVTDNQPLTHIPVFNFIVPSGSPRSWLGSLSCGSYSTFSFAFKGDLHHNVGIRRRGASVCGSTKPFLKVRFHKGHELRFSGNFKGHKNLNFQSLWTDKGLIRENMAWETFNQMDNPYLTDEFVRILANGAYYALYAAMERPDERFLERNGLNPDGNLYKAVASVEQQMADYHQGYEKKTNEVDLSFADLADFLNTMHATPAGGLAAFFKQRVEEDSIIDYQAAQVIINNSDYPHKNHYLYHDTAAGKWRITGWDLDLSFGKVWSGTYSGVYNDGMDNPGITPWYTTQVRGGGTGNYLLDKFFYQGGDTYRRAYRARLWDALEEKYALSSLYEHIDFLRDFLYEEQLLDIAAWGRTPPSANDTSAPSAFEPNLQRIKDHFAIRRPYLLDYLRNIEGFSGHDRLKITEILYAPLGDQEAEFIELWNCSGKNLDISGWTIEGVGAGDPAFTFPAGTVAARDEIFIAAKNPAVFSTLYGSVARIFGPFLGKLSNESETLRVKDDGPGYPATVDYVRYGSSGDWPEEAGGLGYSLELTEVSLVRDNDQGRNWRASLPIGGTPGVVEGINSTPQTFFKRGDANADGAADLSDAVSILLYLFRGAAAPSCLKAADADDNGDVQIADAIALLIHLFRRGPAPRPPYPACGVDTIEDGLTCASFAPCN